MEPILVPFLSAHIDDWLGASLPQRILDIRFYLAQQQESLQKK